MRRRHFFFFFLRQPSKAFWGISNGSRSQYLRFMHFQPLKYAALLHCTPSSRLINLPTAASSLANRNIVKSDWRPCRCKRSSLCCRYGTFTKLRLLPTAEGSLQQQLLLLLWTFSHGLDWRSLFIICQQHISFPTYRGCSSPPRVPYN